MVTVQVNAVTICGFIMTGQKAGAGAGCNTGGDMLGGNTKCISTHAAVDQWPTSPPPPLLLCNSARDLNVANACSACCWVDM